MLESPIKDCSRCKPSRMRDGCDISVFKISSFPNSTVSRRSPPNRQLPDSNEFQRGLRSCVARYGNRANRPVENTQCASEPKFFERAKRQNVVGGKRMSGISLGHAPVLPEVNASVPRQEIHTRTVYLVCALDSSFHNVSCAVCYAKKSCASQQAKNTACSRHRQA